MEMLAVLNALNCDAGGGRMGCDISSDKAAGFCNPADVDDWGWGAMGRNTPLAR